MSTPAVPSEVRVGVADYAVRRGSGVLTTVGLGSCVAIMLHDPVARVGALAHVLLPHESASRLAHNPAKFAETAVPMLVAAMRDAGAGRGVSARLAGGASMFAQLMSNSGVNMGERNVQAALRALADAGVPVVGQDTGGDHGRSVSLDVATGAVCVRSLRKGDRAL